MRERTVFLALVGGGAAWVLHLCAAYVLVALGCPRGWPALGWLLAALTVACASAALAVGLVAVRRRPRARTEDTEVRRLLLGVGALLAGLFALAIVGGGVAALALPPCQGVAIGGGA